MYKTIETGHTGRLVFKLLTALQLVISLYWLLAQQRQLLNPLPDDKF